ncbi:hypothetical protein RB653_001956 [Dictyostelium firmibasis]|uniref:ABC3 transporter permease C-terminal domain-containing protein n=1 Tax=Dictyostelium firmibasis TaxID=79012 RepID=A0AAN7TPV0_9MYCE
MNRSTNTEREKKSQKEPLVELSDMNISPNHLLYEDESENSNSSSNTPNPNRNNRINNNNLNSSRHTKRYERLDLDSKNNINSSNNNDNNNNNNSINDYDSDNEYGGGSGSGSILNSLASHSTPHTDSPFLKSNRTFDTYSLNNNNNNNFKNVNNNNNNNDNDNDNPLSSGVFDLNTVKGFIYYIYFSLRYTLYGDLRVAVKYVHNNSKKNRKSLLLGLFTVFLVVLFISFLQNLIQSSPIVFLKLSEDQAGELDLVLIGDPGNYVSSNQSQSLAVVNTDLEEDKYLDKTTTPQLKIKKSLERMKQQELSDQEYLSKSPLYIFTGFLNGITDQLSFLNMDYSGYFVNSTYLTQRLAGASTVHGVAPRWISIAAITTSNSTTSSSSSSSSSSSNSNDDNDNRNKNGASLLIMSINSTLEKDLGLGRGWTLPPLVGNQIHVSAPFLRRINVEPMSNQLVHLHMDFIDILQRLGLPANFPTFESLIDSIQALIGFPIPKEMDVTELIEAYDLMNPGTHIEDAFSDILGPKGFNIDSKTGTMTLYPLNALKQVYNSIRSDLSIDHDLIVMGSIDEPGGKFPNTIGNVGILESSYLEALVKEKLEQFNDQITNKDYREILTFLEVEAKEMGFSNFTDYISQYNQFVDRFESFRASFKLNDYAMSPVIMLENRVKIYTSSNEDMIKGMMSFTNQVSSLLGISYPVTFTTPLATTLQLFIYTKLSLNQIFNCVAAVLLVLGALMVYSLLLSDVEGKTFEYGMLRAQGMRQYALILLLLTQSLYFSIPGIVFGLFIGWCLYAIVAYFVYVQFVLLPIDLTYHTTSILSGLFMGFLMPIVANIAPIQRALSRTLRDALDVYHQVKNETLVKIEKLEEVGLDVLQTVLAILAVAVGFTVYYLIPLSFTFRNMGLFFGILTGILMGMLFGMSMLAQAVQPLLEKAVIFTLILGPDRRSLYQLVRKNLFSHSTRNSKTATMLTISLTFIIFTGCVFRLQGHNIQELVRLGIGSDISVLATSIKNPVPEADIRAFLDNDIANNSNSVIRDYTVVTFPLDKVMNIRSTHLMPLAEYPSINVRMYGVESNFLSSAYMDFYEVTEMSKTLTYPTIDNGNGKMIPDVINSLYVNEHRDIISEDFDGVITPPPNIISSGSQLYPPNSPVWKWLKNHLNNTYVYQNYTDIIFSEAFRLTCGVNTDSPFNLDIEYKQYSNAVNHITLLAKGQSMVRMFPSFFFSTYSQTSYGSPILVNDNEFYRIMTMVYSVTNDPTVVLPSVAPKSKVLIRLKEGTTEIEREYVINGVRNFIKTDNIQVMDTQHLLDTTDTAVTILNIFFYTVSVASIILCFFMLWVSFSANIHENSWEFGVLRSIGLTSFQVTRIYIYEALVLIFSSMILGLGIGLGIALTLTLQFDLFTELPFSFEFPYFWFIGVLVMSIGIAIFVSYQSSREYRTREIASVLKGK